MWQALLLVPSTRGGFTSRRGSRSSDGSENGLSSRVLASRSRLMSPEIAEGPVLGASMASADSKALVTDLMSSPFLVSPNSASLTSSLRKWAHESWPQTGLRTEIWRLAIVEGVHGIGRVEEACRVDRASRWPLQATGHRGSSSSKGTQSESQRHRSDSASLPPASSIAPSSCRRSCDTL